MAGALWAEASPPPTHSCIIGLLSDKEVIHVFYSMLSKQSYVKKYPVIILPGEEEESQRETKTMEKSISHQVQIKTPR